MPPGINSVIQMLNSVPAAAQSALEAVQQASASMSSSVKQAADEAQKHTDRITKSIDDATKGGATKLDDLIYKLEAAAKNGDSIATDLLNVIHGVENGTVHALDAINAFGDGIVQIDGRTRSFRDLLTEVLPTMGDVQNKIRDTVADIHSYSDAIAALNKIQSAQAKTLAELIAAYKNGKVSVDALVKAAQDLARLYPGSAEAQIAQQVADATRSGGFG